jgi:hypothetical protein
MLPLPKEDEVEVLERACQRTRRSVPLSSLQLERYEVLR